MVSKIYRFSKPKYNTNFSSNPLYYEIQHDVLHNEQKTQFRRILACLKENKKSRSEFENFGAYFMKDNCMIDSLRAQIVRKIIIVFVFRNY